jgi:hypothetical protein
MKIEKMQISGLCNGPPTTTHVKLDSQLLFTCKERDILPQGWVTITDFHYHV